MDYFISHESCEIEGAAAHYSERLVCLSKAVTYAYFYRRGLEGPIKRRSEFGLPESAHVYLCAQSLFKIHPDFDELAERILEADPDAVLVLFEGKYRAWTELLAKRFARTMTKTMDRIRFVPRLPHRDFLNLLKVSDVLLDTPHFSGGRSSVDSLSVGTPIVTLPGTFMRGRQTYALYKRIGVSDCIADSPQGFVGIAMRLGTDRVFRERVQAAILANRHLLYEDIGMVHELEDFFGKSVQQAAAAQVGKR